MTARRLGWVVLAALVGLVGGAAAAYVLQPQPSSAGVATPIPAASPSVPTYSPSSSPSPTVVPDVDYPTLGTHLPLQRHDIGLAPDRWRYAVPQGWRPLDVYDTPLTSLRNVFEVRFRPPDAPAVGAYSIRVKALVANHKTPTEMVVSKLDDLQGFTGFTLLDQTDSALYFTYVDGQEHLRYNFFQWFATPGTPAATLEMSVSGRERDKAGLYDLFNRFADTVRSLG